MEKHTVFQGRLIFETLGIKIPQMFKANQFTFFPPIDPLYWNIYT